MRGPTITAEEIDRMYALRAQGMSNAEIADAMDRSPGSVVKKIGKQPDMNRSTYGSRVAKVTDIDSKSDRVLERTVNISKKHTEACKYGKHFGRAAVYLQD